MLSFQALRVSVASGLNFNRTPHHSGGNRAAPETFSLMVKNKWLTPEPPCFCGSGFLPLALQATGDRQHSPPPGPPQDGLRQ